jgi:hypothetical protein
VGPALQPKHRCGELGFEGGIADEAVHDCWHAACLLGKGGCQPYCMLVTLSNSQPRQGPLRVLSRA